MPEKRVYKDGDQWGQRLDEYVSHQIRYDDSYEPQNGIEDRIARNEQAMGRLLALLNSKGLLSDGEVLDIVDASAHNLEVKVPEE